MHKPLDQFIINTNAFHNAHLLRATLPRALIQPIPLFADRKAKHNELAAILRDTKEARAQAKKRKAEEAGIGGGKRRGRPKQTQRGRDQNEPDEEDSVLDNSDVEDEEANEPPPKKRRTRYDDDGDYGTMDDVAEGTRAEPRRTGRLRRPGARVLEALTDGLADSDLDELDE